MFTALVASGSDMPAGAAGPHTTRKDREPLLAAATVMVRSKRYRKTRAVARRYCINVSYRRLHFTKEIANASLATIDQFSLILGQTAQQNRQSERFYMHYYNIEKITTTHREHVYALLEKELNDWAAVKTNEAGDNAHIETNEGEKSYSTRGPVLLAAPFEPVGNIGEWQQRGQQFVWSLYCAQVEVEPLEATSQTLKDVPNEDIQLKVT
ncbi:hypothetical protein L218DRAFT_950396 [Marasmius fiardii PR-910]|nr:hypothetical protein L218DRAFT_950396 [Marasmius fiardii PR-910]